MSVSFRSTASAAAVRASFELLPRYG